MPPPPPRGMSIPPDSEFKREGKSDLERLTFWIALMTLRLSNKE